MMAYIREDLKGFHPYHAPLKPYEIKVDANENPYAHSPRVLEKIRRWTEDKDNLTRYPDTDVNGLRGQLASVHGVTKEEVIVTVGSDQLIELLMKIFLNPGDSILVPNPSFSMYGLSCILNHGKPVNYELDENFDYDFDKLYDLYNEIEPKMVFICTPNNPTGNLAYISDMKDFLSKVDCPVIIDEAYVEFTEGSMVDYTRDFPNLLVLRTFSKAYGLAGLRIGYGIGQKEMIDAVGIAKPPYNVSSFSQAVAGFVLEDMAYYEQQARELIKSNKALEIALQEIDVIERVYPSFANFILLKIKNQEVIAYLEANQVLVRGYGLEGRLGGHMRLTIGTEAENERILELLKAYK